MRHAAKTPLGINVRHALLGPICLLALGALGCVQRNPGTDELEAVLLPAAMVEAAGERMLQQQLNRTPRTTDLRLRKTVRRIGDHITLSLRGHGKKLPEVQFHVVQDSTVNAMALPGGHIVLTTGMASLLHRDEELLAALLSHEMAHAFCRHTERKLESMITICSAVGAMRINAHRGAGGGRYMDVDVGMRYLRNRYAREQEREADEMALRYLVAAGYSPQAFVRLLHLLAPLAEAPKPPDYIVSHDPPSRRLARIAAVVQPPRMEKGTPREQ